MSEHVENGIVDTALVTRIRLRAYELYEDRGRVHDHALEDWLRAESEVFERFQPN